MATKGRGLVPPLPLGDVQRRERERSHRNDEAEAGGGPPSNSIDGNGGATGKAKGKGKDKDRETDMRGSGQSDGAGDETGSVWRMPVLAGHGPAGIGMQGMGMGNSVPLVSSGSSMVSPRSAVAGEGAGSAHSVYVLVPGFSLAPGLTTAELKERCREQLRSPHIDFLRVSSVTALDDDSSPAPPGVVVTGYKLNSADFTLDFVERTVKQNEALRETLERSAEAILTFEEQVHHSNEVVNSLREQIAHLQREKEALIQRCLALEQNFPNYASSETGAGEALSPRENDASSNQLSTPSSPRPISAASATPRPAYRQSVPAYGGRYPSSAPGSFLSPLLSPGREHKVGSKAI